MENGNDNLDILKFHLDNLKFIWDKVKLQREVMDRYFNYFLLFITTPVLVLSTLMTKINVIDINLEFISMTCVLFSIIGCSFFFMYVKQRINSLKLVNELRFIEDVIKKINNPSHEENINYKFDNRGADFWVSIIQAIVSSFWLSIGIFIFMSKHQILVICKGNAINIGLFIIIAAMVMQNWILFRIRNKWLNNY